ncbi:MAG: FHA domain-containing protein [Anaerolineae bacterium]|nr:FHA domain-containing protein [Anaerolineae bacterium]
MAVQSIFAEYIRLRSSGLDARSALDSLRSQIEALNDSERQDLARRVRTHETVTPPEKTEPTRTLPIRNIAKKGLTPQPPAVAEVVWVNCPHCGKSNQKQEVVCYACGQLLEPPVSEFETRTLAETNDLAYSQDFFGYDSLLMLQVRGADTPFTVHPQKSDHELVIGRITTGSAVVPDIDVGPFGGDKLGVSRLHLTIRYEANTHTLSVFDLGSSNGSYINGQRLHPHEVRVLRDGDELRLGKLVLTVRFKHGE